MVSVSTLNAGISSSINMGLKCGIGTSLVARVVAFGKNLYLPLASLKFVTFVTMPPKVVNISLDY